jgi:hypothetical protein
MPLALVSAIACFILSGEFAIHDFICICGMNDERGHGYVSAASSVTATHTRLMCKLVHVQPSLQAVVCAIFAATVALLVALGFDAMSHQALQLHASLLGDTYMCMAAVGMQIICLCAAFV